jgi:hypothetical protein
LAAYDPRKTFEANWKNFEDIITRKVACLTGFGFDYEAQLRSRLFSAEERVFCILNVADWFLVHPRAERQIDSERRYDDWRPEETGRLIGAGMRIIDHFREKAPDTAQFMLQAFSAVERYALAELDEADRKQAGEELFRIRGRYVHRLPEIREFMVECMLDAAAGCDLLTEVRTEERRDLLIATRGLAHAFMNSAAGTYYDRRDAGFFEEEGNGEEHDRLKLRKDVFSKLFDGIRKLQKNEETELDLEVDTSANESARQELAEELYGLVYRLRRAGVEVRASVFEVSAETDLTSSMR